MLCNETGENSQISYFLEMVEYNEERHPWESMEEKLSLVRYKKLLPAGALYRYTVRFHSLSVPFA